jgi:CheY-like chemotaxis protein
MAARVFLLHWDEPESDERARELAAAGYTVEHESRFDPSLLRSLAESPPDAIVVDLSRSPSLGRDVALALRTRAGTRRVPLVVAGGKGDAEKGLRAHLPDVFFTSWGSIASTLERAIAEPPADPVVPTSALAGYSGTPLPRKLVIKEGSKVGLVGAPANFAQRLGELPDGARVRRGARGADLVLWFVRSTRLLTGGLQRYAALEVPVWIFWPKQASGVDTDLTQNVVRAAGLGAGLVDYKVCAVDETWSGLLFRRRR